MLRYLYLLRGNPARWLPLFAWVAIDIVLWGYISRYLNSVTASGLNFVPSFLGAVLLFDFFTRVMHGVAGVFLEDVWSRNFLNLFASPLTLSQYLLGLVITSTATSLIGLIVMLVLATLVFGLSFFSYGLTLIPFLLILFVFGVALGIFGSAVVLRFGPASEWFVWPIPALVTRRLPECSTRSQPCRSGCRLFPSCCRPPMSSRRSEQSLPDVPRQAPHSCWAGPWSSLTSGWPAGSSGVSLIRPCARASSPATARRR